MADILNYIAKQVESLTDTISDNDTLKSVGLYEIINFVAQNPEYIYGGRNKYYDTKGDIDSSDALISARYGMNVEFLQKVKDEALTKPTKEQAPFFRNTIYARRGTKDRDVLNALTKLFQYSSFDKLAKAIANTINYAVLNTQYQDIITYRGFDGISKFTNNLTFEDLPYGKLSPIPYSVSSIIKEPLQITPDNLYTLCKELTPIDLNFTDSDVDSSLKFFRCVANEDEQYVRLFYPKNSARAFIKNDKLSFNLTDNNGESFSCKPLSIETKTDWTETLTTYIPQQEVFYNATKYKLLPSTTQPGGCSTQELTKIAQDHNFVQSLSTNEDFSKIESISGKQLLNQIYSFAEISRCFEDADSGVNSISLKVFFDKKEDVFASVRSTDLWLAVFGATYGFGEDVLVDFYFNPNTEEIYVVNQNNEQYGYCEGLIQGDLSNCEYVIYAQLLQPSLSDMAKYNLMVDENILPVILDEGVVRETTGLQDALNRQNYLLALQDDDLFFQLFLRNIASYIYSYAKEVEVKLKFYENTKDGETKQVERTQIVWRPVPNPKWSETYDPKTKKVNDEWVDDRWGKPNYYHIYDVRETFWHMNNHISFKELLAFFVSKSGKLPNISYYRELSQRILGVDYYLFAKKLIPSLLDDGVLCIEVLDYEQSTGALKQVKYSPSPEYASGDVYTKLYKLESDLGENIKMLYGEVKGIEYIDRQRTLLNNARPEQITFGNQIPKLNLKLNIHNPIFFNDTEGYVGRTGQATGTLNDGRVVISTYEKDNSRYKKLSFDTGKPTEQTRQVNYNNWRAGMGMSYTHHLAQFEGWLMYGNGRSAIGKDYITPNNIIDGYVYPKGKDLFVPDYIMPEFSDKAKRGKPAKLPLRFLDRSTAPKSTGKFSFTMIYNTSKQGDLFGNSYLTQLSREHLIKAGIVKKKKKIKHKNDTFTPITKEEGKEIYNVILTLYNKLESEIKLEGDSLFTLFCQQQMTPEYRKEIELLWNATYNNLSIPVYSKFPIFCEHSRWFGSILKPFLFNLREAQIEGMKFSVSNQNAGLLAHEVGFGKTTTSIALISHMNLTGESSRNLIFTPNQVYEKFYDEITGNIKTRKLGLLGNWKTPYNVVKMKNALKDILLGPTDKNGYPIDKTGLKDYDIQELEILAKSKNISDWARDKFDTEMQMKQARFFTEGSFEEYPKIDKRVSQSDALDWFETFRGDLEAIHIPEIKDYYEQVDGLLNKVEREINSNVSLIKSRIRDYKRKNRYQPFEFSPANVKTLPNYLKNWYRKAKAKGSTPGYKIPYNTYPTRYWIKDVDGAVEIGAITPKQEQDIKTNIIGAGQKWEGTLTPEGMKKILSYDEELSNEFYSRSKKTGKVIRMLNAIRDMLVDELGVYKKYVYKANTIILCSYDKSGGSIKRFRVSRQAREDAQKYISNVDYKGWVPSTIRRTFDELEFRPLSLMKLNVSGIVVDEIHNFNNLVGKPRTHTLSLISEMRGGQKDKNLHLLPTQYASAYLSTLPDGSNVSVSSGMGEDSAYKISYNTGGKTSLMAGPTNLMSIIFEIQNNSLNREMNTKNSIVMSATPFTDNVFQMFSVLGLTNRDRLKDSNLDKVFSFFITFVKEEWRFNITHKNEFGLFAEIQGYYNTFAMSNFIKALANFKVSDADIEKSRPEKYLIPQEKGLRDQAGANTSNSNYSKYLEDVESYITLTDEQRQMMDKVAEFVEGTADNPYAICPNWKDAIQVTKEGLSITDPEIKEEWESFQAKLKDVKSDEANRNDHLQYAFEIIDSLKKRFPDILEIDKEWDKVDKLLFSTDEDEKEEQLKEVITDWENIGLMALDEEQVFSARAILGQSYGQRLVLSPYLLSCDKEGNLANSLLKPLDKNDLSKSAKNFIEASPKLQYAVDCALDSIKYDAQNSQNNYFIGGQIIYLDTGKAFKYGGEIYNAYALIKQYIIDQKFSYKDKGEGGTGKMKFIDADDIEIITGGMSKLVNMEEIDSKGRVRFKYDDEGNIEKQGVREEIRDKFNDGRCKILIGSSAIREGIDLNKRAHTLYITDSDFSPSNAMQLEGRIWRQGNAWENVRIVYVLGRDSIDAFVYSKLQQKIGEIKKMLEAGVYEMNKTQFTINAKERIKKIISDVDKLAELEWQDEDDRLKIEKANLNQQLVKLGDIEEYYAKYKSAFKLYINHIKVLYEVVISDEKLTKAKELKQKLDIIRERKYSTDNKDKSPLYRQKNPYKPLTISEALDELENRIKNNEEKLGIPNLKLNESTRMTAVNDAVDRVRRILLNNKNGIHNLINLDSVGQQPHLNKPDTTKNTAEKLLTALLQIKPKWHHFDEVLTYVSEFAKGTAKEGLLADYSYLIADRVKMKNGKEVLKNGKKVMYDFSDIEDLQTDLRNSERLVGKQQNSEGAYKTKIKKKIKRSQEQSKIKVGLTLAQQIQNFQKSRPLIKVRKKSKK